MSNMCASHFLLLLQINPSYCLDDAPRGPEDRNPSKLLELYSIAFRADAEFLGTRVLRERHVLHELFVKVGLGSSFRKRSSMATAPSPYCALESLSFDEG